MLGRRSKHNVTAALNALVVNRVAPPTGICLMKSNLVNGTSLACQPYSHKHHRYFSTDNNEFLSAVVLDEAAFHQIADRTLDELDAYLGELQDNVIDELDCELSQGVLNFAMTEKDVKWVINKQTPNRQLWWSSPISGPRRYELIDEKHTTDSHNKYSEVSSRWINLTDIGSVKKGDKFKSLFELLREEILQTAKLDKSDIEKFEKYDV